MIQKAYMVPHPPLIVPDVGRGQEKTIQKTVDNYERFAKEIAELKPDTIIISTPHSVMYRDYNHISPGRGASGNFANFGAPQVRVSVDYDTELVDLISKKAYDNHLSAGTLGEQDARLDHATLIPLYFINKEDPTLLDNTKVVRVGLSGLPLSQQHELGSLIDEAAEELGRKVVYIASGDLSHVLKADGPYGYKKEGPEFDQKFVDIVNGGDLDDFMKIDESLSENASECGLRSFVIMAGALEDYDYQPELSSYEGPFGVGYGCAEIDIKGRKNGQ